MLLKKALWTTLADINSKMWRRRVSSTEEKYLWISPLAFLREQGDVIAAPIHVFDDHEIKPYLVGYSAYPLSRWLQKP